MKVYALTGGIASGKSAASRRFVERGIPVIDADRVGHDVIATGGAAEQAVADAFGSSIVRCGKIDREALGAIVFADDEARKTLNAIVHPAIRVEIAKRIAAFLERGTRAVIVDAALHAENGEMPPGFEALILVLCPDEERQRRLVENRNMTPDAAMARINAQTPPATKIPLARWIVDNSGTIEHLERQVDEIAEEILGDAA